MHFMNLTPNHDKAKMDDSFSHFGRPFKNMTTLFTFAIEGNFCAEIRSQKKYLQL